eukprot:1136358-Pelagomonas_calceolata.AAC.1
MEQDSSGAAHHQQATSLVQACLLACGSRGGKQQQRNTACARGPLLKGTLHRIQAPLAGLSRFHCPASCKHQGAPLECLEKTPNLASRGRDLMIPLEVAAALHAGTNSGSIPAAQETPKDKVALHVIPIVEDTIYNSYTIYPIANLARTGKKLRPSGELEGGAAGRLAAENGRRGVRAFRSMVGNPSDPHKLCFWLSSRLAVFSLGSRAWVRRHLIKNTGGGVRVERSKGPGISGGLRGGPECPGILGHGGVLNGLSVQRCSKC